MEESENTPNQNSGAPAFLQIALATIAIALGGAALFLAINSAKKASALSDEINEKIEKIAAAAIDVKKTSDRLDSLAAMVEDNKSADKLRIDNFGRQVQNVLENLSSNVKANRELIEANQKAIQELAGRGQRASASQSKQTQSNSSEASAKEQVQTSADGSIVHVVEAGDTFSKIAAKYKVSVESIEKANPGVSSNRLRIGQKINVVK